MNVTTYYDRYYNTYIVTELIKLFGLHYSHKKTVEKSSYENVKLIKNNV